MSYFEKLIPAEVRPLPEGSRILDCTSCGNAVAVIEVPAGHLDPATFVGTCCLRYVDTDQWVRL